jgi:hypothetical protein
VRPVQVSKTVGSFPDFQSGIGLIGGRRDERLLRPKWRWGHAHQRLARESSAEMNRQSAATSSHPGRAGFRAPWQRVARAARVAKWARAARWARAAAAPEPPPEPVASVSEKPGVQERRALRARALRATQRHRSPAFSALNAPKLTAQSACALLTPGDSRRVRDRPRSRSRSLANRCVLGR